MENGEREWWLEKHKRALVITVLEEETGLSGKTKYKTRNTLERSQVVSPNSCSFARLKPRQKCLFLESVLLASQLGWRLTNGTSQSEEGVYFRP